VGRTPSSPPLSLAVAHAIEPLFAISVGPFAADVPMTIADIVHRPVGDLPAGDADDAWLDGKPYFRAVVEQSTDVVLVLDRVGRLCYASPSAERTLGHSPAALLGTPVFDLLHADDVPAAMHGIGRTLDGAPQRTQVRVRHADGSWRVLEAVGSPLAPTAAAPRDDDAALVVNLRDVTARVADDEALRRSEERFRTLSASSPVGIFQSDPSGHVTYVNERLLRICGATEHEVLGLAWMARVHPDDRSALVAGWTAALGVDREYEHDYRLLLDDGSIRHVHGRAAPFRDASGTVVGTVGTIVDTTERRRMELALGASEERLRLALGAAQMVAWELDGVDDTGAGDTPPGGVCASARGGTGGGLGLVSYGAFLRAVHPDDRARIEQGAAQALAEGADFEAEFRMVLESGEVRWRSVKGRTVVDAAGGARRMLGVGVDVTERKRLEAELRRHAFHDALTGLANRALFRERVDHALAHDDGGGAVAVLFVDLDDFKTVNDSLGHDVGDRLLACAAERLQHATRGCDTVARLGGDEFGILLRRVCDGEEAAMVADRVVAALRAPFHIDGHAVRTGASIGIGLAAPGAHPDDLLRNADLAMYRAKGAGKGRHETFVPAMHAAALDRLTLLADLGPAIDAGQLVLHYQPIVDLPSGRTIGAEALVRWQHPQRGLLGPGAFIALAEDTGDIVPLGRWVLREACARATTWEDEPGHAPFVTVNISVAHLRDPSLVDDVRAALDASGLPADRLVVEITESVLAERVEDTLARLSALKALGVRLALDDFGTGFSSLAYLQRFPFDVLKIDKAFVEGVAGTGQGAALARTIVGLANALSLRTVAEGVERADQRETLAALGCDAAQGYLFARPLPAPAFAELLRRG